MIYWGLLFSGEKVCKGLTRLYETMSISEIADYLGVSGASVHGKLKECEIKRRPVGGSTKRYSVADMPDLANCSIEQLAAATGYSKNYCRKLRSKERTK